MTKYVAKNPNLQGLIDWTDAENETWSKLYARQIKNITNKAHSNYIIGLEKLNLSPNRVPQLFEVNKRLSQTGWEAVCVKGTIYVKDFFKLLSERKFPCATFIRVPEELDYLQQPDIFHEVFGHCPMLMNTAFADLIQWFGEFAEGLSNKEKKVLSRLFWFTIEFGLINTNAGARIYGAGILSSFQETNFCLSAKPAKRMFSPELLLDSNYIYSQIQDEYFVLKSFDDLLNLKYNENFKKLIQKAAGTSDVKQEEFIDC